MKKYLLLGVVLLITISLSAQRRIFIRVYDSNGSKINKGFIQAVTDSMVVLVLNKKLQVINFKNIGSITTKRSEGSNVLTGAEIFGIVGILVSFVGSGVVTSSFVEFSPLEAVPTGLIGGAVLGSVIGGITIAFKNQKNYIISGDENKWKIFENAIYEQLLKQ